MPLNKGSGKLFGKITFHDWVNIIDEGTYMKGVMKEGN
jgi:hypothetical protein